MTSCTAGLELALRAVEVGQGDEVIVPAYTFIATALAPLTTGADIVFVDMDPKTFCITPVAVESAVTPRTKAVIPVHFAGHPADAEGLQAVAQKHRLKLVWDTAHAHTTEWWGKKVGGLDPVSSYSFNHAKNLTCGEGGWLPRTMGSLQISPAIRSLLSDARKTTPGTSTTVSVSSIH